MPFNFNCLNCNAELEAEDDWGGQETTCPECSQVVTIPSPPSSPANHGRKAKLRFNWLGGGKKYIWGRLYIFCIWIVVGFVFCAGIVGIIFHLVQYSSEKEMRREELWKAIPILQERQEKFSQNLHDTIDLLSEKKSLGSSQTNSEITGFKLPDSIRQKEIVFNDELDSIRAVEASLAVAKESIETIKELELCLEKDLRSQLQGLQRLIEHQSSLSPRSSSLGVSDRRAAAIKADFSKKVNFYSSERDKFYAIQAIRREVDKVSSLYSGNQKLRGELGRLLLFLDFIEGNLLSRNSTLQLEQLQSNFASQQPSDIKEKKTVPGEKEYGNILQQLSILYLAWANESDQGEWHIAQEAKNLQTALSSHLDGIRQEEGIASRELRQLLFNSLKILFCCIVLSFALLVIADVLRAHFDCAENTLKK